MAQIYLLNNEKYPNTKNLDVFCIEYIPSQINIEYYDALVFTSKNAVYSLNSFNQDWKNIDSYAIAQKTASIIKENGGKVVFTGNSGHGNDFAKELLNILKNKKVLYVKALKTVSNLTDILKENNINVDEIITYKTTCSKKKYKLEDNSTFIFTSPSSVKCFFKNYKWDKSYKAIVIGKTTASYLPKDIKYEISEKTSIEECIKLAFK